jgi:hypothetical protein
MAPGANALVNRTHDLPGIVFQELLDALRIHSCNVEIRGMMHVHGVYALTTRQIGI